MSNESNVAHAARIGREQAHEDLITGNDRTGDDVIADTEVLVFSITGEKLHEADEDDVIEIVEAFEEAYIDTYMSGVQDAE